MRTILSQYLENDQSPFNRALVCTSCGSVIEVLPSDMSSYMLSVLNSYGEVIPLTEVSN